jgi:hypothetical protein
MNEEYEEEELTPEELAEFAADAAAHETTMEDYPKHWLFKMLADEAAIQQLDEQ